MKTVEARKFLVRNVIDARSGNLPLRLVDLTGPQLSVTAFERETAGTIFVDNTVVLIRRSLVESQLKALETKLSDPASRLTVIDDLRELGALAYPGYPSSDVLPLMLY